MLPDVISHDANRHGTGPTSTGQAGVFSGMWTAGETTGMALGATVLTVVLAATGYVQSTAGAAVTQPPEAVVGIVLSFSLVPAVIMGLSLIALRRYRLRKADIDVAVEVAP